MKISSATLFVLAAAASVFAQQQQAPLHVTSTYFHAADGKGQAYVEFSRNHTKKIMEAVFQADPAYRAVTLSQVVYEGNPAPGYNYVLSTFREGAPPGERAVLDAAAKKVAGMTYGDLTKASAFRTRVGQVLSRQVASAGTEAVKEGDIIRVDFMKTAEGRAADYCDMERNEFKAIHEQNIKKGAVKRWAVWPAALPPGDGVPYDAMTTAVYRDMASALQRPRYEAAFREARPDQSFAGVSEKARTTRKRVRSEARRVAWVVSRPN